MMEWRSARDYNLRQGVLRYDSDLDRYCLDEGDQITSVHCGEVVGIRIGDGYVWGCVEMDRHGEWYIIFPAPPGQRDSAFTLRSVYDARVNW